ncbi:MAG: MotA/TolQ/ExbB proton channel family protein [Bacteroidota bacterium]
MSQFGSRIMEGGPLFMIPILLILLITLVLFILSLVGKRDLSKTKEIIHHLSLFAMTWGFLGSTIGLINAFDAIASIGDVSKGLVAGGLKVALLNTLFGLFTFSLDRIFILILTMKNK